MKRLVSIVLGLIILAGVVQALQPNTYHVSPSGNDKNPGTYLLPLRTIQAGINKAYPGDTVMVLAGTYNEQLTFPRSGTSGFPITVRGEVDSKGNPLAIIDNTTPVTGAWTAAPEVGSGVYKKVGFAPDIVLYDGKQILRISKERMAGDSDYYCDKGFHVLAYPADKVWYPFGEPVPVNFWDDVKSCSVSSMVTQPTCVSVMAMTRTLARYGQRDGLLLLSFITTTTSRLSICGFKELPPL